MIAPIALTDAPPATPRRRTLKLVDDETWSRIDREVRHLLAPGAEHDPTLAAAVADMLATPGSLWRAQLAWAVARAEGASEDSALAVAAAVESFHTASLLFDDLPSMDDGEERRGRPCSHRVHGEAAAILAALAFVHRGYARLWAAFEDASVEARRAAARLVEECLGLDGVLDGQARDVHFDPSSADAEDVVRIAAGKTVTLLRLALVLPARLASGPRGRVDAYDRLARSWGLAYQILDDLEEPGDGHRGDDARRGRPNLALVAGRREALGRLLDELGSAEVERRSISRELPGLTVPLARLSARFARGAAAQPRIVAGGAAG